MNLQSNSTAAIVALFIIFVSVFLTFGCTKEKLYTNHIPESQHDAASIHLSVTLVSPWSEYVSSLQPNFDLDAEGALKRVIPRTTLLEERVINSLGLAAKTGLPQTIITESNTTTVEDNTETTRRIKTQERKPGELPEDETGSNAPSIKDSALRGLPEGADKSLSVEPMLQYTAAAALYQEVQLLNRYVNDAALKYDFQPYIVRMQIGVMPYARNQPLDVYTTFGFFPFTYKNELKNYRAVVLPMLVTDNLEGALKSKSIDNIRQLALALSFLSGGVTGEVGLEKMREDMNSVLSTDLNSLLTVGRVTDGAIQVRLGATRQASSEFAMVPRTHNITLLMMVPNDFLSDKSIDPKVKVVAKTVLRRYDTGEKIEDRTNIDETTDYLKVLNEYYPDWEAKPEHVMSLRLEMFENDYPGFWAILKENLKRKPERPRSVWMEFIEIASKNDLTSAVFDLPQPEKLKWPLETQAVLLMDDTKSSLSGKLYGGKGIDPNSVSALLNLRLKNNDTLPIVATAVNVNSEGCNLVLKFPSLRAWKISEIDSKESLLKNSSIELTYTPNNSWRTSQEVSPARYINIYYIAKEETLPLPNFSIRSALDTIAINDDGEGTLQLFIETKKKMNQHLTDAVEIVIANAQIDKIEPIGKVTTEFGKIISPVDTTLNISLKNLVVGETVVIKTKGKYGDKPSGGPHPPIEIKIRKNK